MLRRLFALAVLIAAAQPAAAAPEDVIKALEGKSPTLLELAMARLEAAVQAHAAMNGISAWVWQDGADIYIDLWQEAGGDEARCKELLQGLQVRAAVDPATGYPLDPSSAFASYFSFPGSIDEFAVDPSWVETVDSMFVVRAVLGFTGNGDAQTCKVRLLSNQIEFSKE